MNATRLLSGSKTLVMGIVNMTADSFSGCNAAPEVEAAVARALALVDEGADIIDFGAESTRPHATPLSAAEETDRLGDAVARLHAACDVAISVDTYHAETAAEALRQGADIINDVTALRGGWEADDATRTDMARVVADAGAVVVLMDMPEAPSSGLVDAGQRDIVGDVCAFLRERAAWAERHGVARERIWLDPGFGFSKSYANSVALFRGLDAVVTMGYPVLCGFSRKRLVGDVLGLPADQRLEGSLALAVMAAMAGVRILRVHDVGPTVRALGMVDAMRQGTE